jgi:hypothetical protein
LDFVGIIIVDFHPFNFRFGTANLSVTIGDNFEGNWKIVGTDEFFHHRRTVYDARDGDGFGGDTDAADGMSGAKELGEDEVRFVGEVFFKYIAVGDSREAIIVVLHSLGVPMII